MLPLKVVKISHVLNQRRSYNFKCGDECRSLNVVSRTQKHPSFRHKLPLLVWLVRSCCLSPIPTPYPDGYLRRHSMSALEERFLHFHRHKVDVRIIILETLASVSVGALDQPLCRLVLAGRIQGSAPGLSSAECVQTYLLSPASK